MSEAEILFETKGALGLVTLNRPKALNALTADMCVKLADTLERWEADDAVKAVAVIGAGDKAFCAGGDVVKVTKSYAAGTKEWQDFFYNEYRMNVAIDAFSKPYISFVDGITMGGGVGVSIPGDYWIASEKTLFAMPETGLGLFPDVGGGYFLPRLPGASGMYLALTGARLKAPDLYALGLASHVINSDRVDAALEQLSVIKDASSVKRILDDLHQDPAPAPIAEFMEQIDDYFDGASVEAIIGVLENDQGDWAQKQAKLLKTKSPTSLKLTFEQLRRGAEQPDFASNMQMEYRLVNRILAGNDFAEGVRAILIDKDQNPVWSPASLDAVDDAAIMAHFDPLPIGEDLLDRISQEKAA